MVVTAVQPEVTTETTAQVVVTAVQPEVTTETTAQKVVVATTANNRMAPATTVTTVTRAKMTEATQESSGHAVAV